MLSVILSNLNRFSHFLHCQKAYEICYSPYNTIHLTLGMLLHYLGKLQNSNFWQPVNCACVCKVFNSLLTSRFVQRSSRNSSVNLFAVYPFKYKLFIKILSWLLNTMLIVDKHCSDICCDEFSVPQIDRKSK